jgi:hydrogenase expression/formation protein HypC
MSDAEFCRVEDGCVVCGDVAVPVTVLRMEGIDALCRDEAGNEAPVAVELVGAVSAGDRLLVHAGVAIEKLVR